MIRRRTYRDNRSKLRHAHSFGELNMLEIGHGTHPGMRHSYNEDCYSVDAAAGLCVLVDAMGGPGHGDAAAAQVCDQVLEGMRTGMPLQDAIQDAGKALREHTHKHPGPLPIGATLAALRWTESRFELAWVGACRIWLAPPQCFELATPAHSADPSLIEASALSVQPAPKGGQQSSPAAGLTATQALGLTASDTLRVHTRAGSRCSGMRFLLCTDGIDGPWSALALHTTLRREELGAQECVDQLLLTALEHGSRDNLSAILIRMR